MSICDHCGERTFAWTAKNGYDLGECSNCGRWDIQDHVSPWESDEEYRERIATDGPLRTGVRDKIGDDR